MDDISFILNELGEDRENYFNAIAPPIIQTSNFRVNKVDELKKLFEDEYSGYLYSRGINPTVDILRKKLAALDGAEDCLVFNSGAAAIFAAVLANVKSGDHIVSVDKPYTWAQRMFDVILPRFGVTTTYIDGTKIENFERAHISLWFRLIARMGGVLDPDGQMPKDMRLTFRRGRLALRAAVQRMLAWKPERVILAHGRWYPVNGVEELRRAFRWVLR